MQTTKMTKCSTYTIQLCKAEKELIKQIQDNHWDKTDSYLSIPRAIKQIIKEWRELKDEKG